MKDFDGDVNARDEADRTPLHHAAIENNYQQATLLLAQGADVNAKDSFGYTPLHSAREAGWWRRRATVKVLLEYGAKDD